MRSTTLGVAGAVLLGAFALQAGPTLAATVPTGASPLILVASGGWATRVEGKRSADDNGYYRYDNGPDGAYGYGRGYPARAYGSEPAPYGYGAGYGSGYGAY